MHNNLSKICGSGNDGVAFRLYLECCIVVAKALDISFPENMVDPIVLTEKVLNGELSETERWLEAENLRSTIESRGWLRNFRDREPLLVKLALCFLDVQEKDVNIESFGNSFEIFVEILYSLGLDVYKAESIIEEFSKRIEQ